MPTRAHILIVEDDHSLSRLYAKVLQREGMRTLLTETAAEAILNLEDYDPDVVSLDWQLHDGTSAAVLEAIRATPIEHRPKVVLLSGNIHHEGLNPYQDLIETYLEKPINAHALVEAIRKLAHQASIDRQPLQKISCTEVSAGVVVMRWQGHVTVSVLGSLMEPRLAAAHTVVFDIRRLNIARLHMGHANTSHPPVPNLQQVWVVHAPDAGTDAHYLMSYLSSTVPMHYTTDFAAAMTAATATTTE